jgi:hypothetical protein
MRISLLAAGLCMAGVLSAQAPVSVVVTVEGQKGAAPPKLAANDVLVHVAQQRQKVTGWDRVRDRQLWVLIDDGSATSLGVHLNEMRKFMEAQPASTQIGVGYLNHGTVETAQALTADHARAAKALRLPLGTPGISASPYLALTDLIRHKWPASAAAREVLMISSGIDPDFGAGPNNPYLEECRDAAQRAGVVVYAIHFPGAGHVGHSYWHEWWGQIYLAQLTDETGGEFYWLGFTAPVSLQPYFDQLSERFSEQYILNFQAQGKPGFERLRLSTELPHVSLDGPDRVYVPKTP